ncbi:unnamed protein product [Rhodiola kirilowii]
MHLDLLQPEIKKRRDDPSIDVPGASLDLALPSKALN